MSIGFWAKSSALYCSTLIGPAPGTRCSAASAACCGTLMPLLPLLCTLHLKAVWWFFTAVLICILVQHLPHSRSKYACLGLLRRHAGGLRMLAADQCRTTADGSGLAGLPLLLQTLRGEPAKGCTTAEWFHVMTTFKEQVEAALRGHKWLAAAGRRARPLWSFDNDKIHQNVQARASLQINANNRYPLPANSPDMHRVVERCIGRLKARFQKWLYEQPAPRTVSEYKAALVNIFFKSPTVASAKTIAADVDKLPELFPHILAAQGDWPPKSQL